MEGLESYQVDEEFWDRVGHGHGGFLEGVEVVVGGGWAGQERPAEKNIVEVVGGGERGGGVQVAGF